MNLLTVLIQLVEAFQVSYSLDGSKYSDRGQISVNLNEIARFTEPVMVPTDLLNSTESQYYIKLTDGALEMIKQIPLVFYINSACFSIQGSVRCLLFITTTRSRIISITK
jgi:hypothetical protein